MRIYIVRMFCRNEEKYLGVRTTVDDARVLALYFAKVYGSSADEFDWADGLRLEEKCELDESDKLIFDILPQEI